ncbi:glycosyltransferase family 2 protein [Microvirga flavescens]|uniref:glycosyltransferase family 2 protein n=1 Tax=Microvirga flavescens TaxID=2249811 RepID=UPI0013008391|nr:glycosyltransferase [Microvirga flavescens]
MPSADWMEVVATPAPAPAKGAKTAGKKQATKLRARDVESPQKTLRTYLAVFANSPATAQLSRKQPLQVLLQGRGDAAFQGTLPLTQIDLPQLAASNVAGLISAACRKAGREELATLLGASIQVKPASAFGPFYLDRTVMSGSAVVLEGWIANLSERAIHLVSGDLRSCVFRSSIAIKPRRDVHEHLRKADALTAASNEHGFFAVAPVADEESAREIYFLEISGNGATATFYGPVQTNFERNETEALNMVRNNAGDIQALPKEDIDRFYRPVLSVPKAAAQARKFHFGPALPSDGRRLASIIIPFYGDAFFLNCVHHLQRVLDDSFELVIVVDDPRIWPEIYTGLTSRSTSITIPTTLLQNVENYGYGRANNLGFMAASGDVLFLMNSDIMVMDAAPLKRAAETIRERASNGEPEVVVGFSLLYEDDTIQHMGMSFPKSSLVGNLHLADHPMKGLPFSLYDGDLVRQVPAVTAALLGISSPLFGKLGGFDTVYERGDFEDADLCLRAAAMGADIELHVSAGLYHLERQSIPNMGSQDLRGMVTYMNCVEFNERWANRLAETAGSGRQRRVHRIVPAQQKARRGAALGSKVKAKG